MPRDHDFATVEELGAHTGPSVGLRVATVKAQRLARPKGGRPAILPLQSGAGGKSAPSADIAHLVRGPDCGSECPCSSRSVGYYKINDLVGIIAGAVGVSLGLITFVSVHVWVAPRANVLL